MHFAAACSRPKQGMSQSWEHVSSQATSFTKSRRIRRLLRPSDSTDNDDNPPSSSILPTLTLCIACLDQAHVVLVVLVHYSIAIRVDVRSKVLIDID